MITREPFEFPEKANRMERILLSARESMAETGRGVLLGVRAIRALSILRRPRARAGHAVTLRSSRCSSSPTSAGWKRRNATQ